MLSFMVMPVPFVHMLVLDEANRNGQGDSRQEGRGEPELVVGMERHFRQ